MSVLGLSVLPLLMAVLGWQEGKAAPEVWQGTVQVGGLGQKIDITVAFVTHADGSVTATFGLVGQNVNGIPLSEVTFDAEQIGFTLAKPAHPEANETYRAKRTSKGSDRAAGTLVMRGMEIGTIAMRKLAPGEQPTSSSRRPQTPRPPFPYEQRAVTCVNPNDQVTRAGTLSIPASGAPHPAVILESGSGPQDRDTTLAGHKAFLVIADYLTQNGIAVLRTDDRGVGASTGNDADATYEDLTGDLLAAVQMLTETADIDAAKIGVLGISQGATIGPMAAARSSDVAFVVMLGGMGVPGDQVMFTQKRMILESMGVQGEWLDQRMAAQRTLLDLLLHDADEATLRKHIEGTLDVEIAPADRSQVTADVRNSLVASGLASVTSNTLRCLVKNRPETYLTKVKQPVLAAFGRNDLQVEPIQNEAAAKKLLAQASNLDVTTWIVPRMSHNLQTTDTGRIDEYGEIEETVKPELLERIAKWIRSKTGLE